MTCPICQKLSESAHKPFCSRRCADIDLGRWLNASYALPTTLTQEDDEGQPRTTQHNRHNDLSDY